MTQVTIYTDGACSGNPGPGGYGTILKSGKHERELAQGYRRTTNNRMELMAVVAGLKILTRPCSVTLYSDSRYVVDGIEKGWAKSWQARGWKKADKQPARNADLWGLILELTSKHRVKLVWVKGHASNPGNNRCDELAVTASKSADLIVDQGYEVEQAATPGLI
jgi:ribonuclease HI